MTDTSWFDDVISWGEDAWNGIQAIGEALLEGVLLAVAAFGLVGLLLAIGPSILLLLAGAPAWAALLLLLA